MQEHYSVLLGCEDRPKGDEEQWSAKEFQEVEFAYKLVGRKEID